MDDDREAVKLWRVHKTVHEMVADRGYLVGDHELNMSLEDWKGDHYRNGVIDRVSLTFLVNHRDQPDDQLFVFFADDETVGIKPIRKFVAHEPQITTRTDHSTLNINLESSPINIELKSIICERMMQESIFKSILVYRKSLTPSAHKVIQEMAPKYDIAIFLEAELMVNITHHSLVPKHVLLSKEEKSTLLQRYRLKDSQLPRIQQSDPVARYYGLKRGQVVKITRPSETAGRYNTYRICF
ncbi:UNVERIFIED_CONTAM: DNA-directed RNA polymerases II 24 kDa polypeptide (RNA polymerase II subunit 5) [Siphonaria sp. JEL0065]|nr:DNA-directed RNA polymerases II 24 kDa polypeptide (RNA polymerase II subunit 5) [Siphonaria sp. JEL0065]